ncbi:hypothetical protein E2320_006707 [Naja naja]|nr:hypothetical protein E2320_006707 [Naja naja]
MRTHSPGRRPPLDLPPPLYPGFRPLPNGGTSTSGSARPVAEPRSVARDSVKRPSSPQPAVSGPPLPPQNTRPHAWRGWGNGSDGGARPARIILAHIRQSHVTSDDTGMCEMVLIDHDVDLERFHPASANGEDSSEGPSSNGEPQGYVYSQSRLERLRKERQNQIKCKNVQWKERNATCSVRLEQCPLQLNNPFNEYSKFDGKVSESDPLPCSVPFSPLLWGLPTSNVPIQAQLGWRRLKRWLDP